jgi:hypothetical protein
MSGGSGWFDVGRGSRVHNPPVAEDLVPVRKTSSRSVMVTALLVNIVEQPWSHNWPMERSELDCREGNMCAKRTDAGKPGIWSKPLCVLEMAAPSRRVTEMASRVLDVLKKWPVAPVSIIVVGFVGGEGVDCLGVTLLLAAVKLLAVGTGVTGPLNQERREVQDDPLRGLGTKLMVSPPSCWWRLQRPGGLRQDRDMQHWCG